MKNHEKMKKTNAHIDVKELETKNDGIIVIQVA